MKVTTKDLKHAFTHAVLRVSSHISAEPRSLSLSPLSHIQIPDMVYELSAKHVCSQEVQTSVDTGSEPQPGIAHSHRHMAQAEQQEAVLQTHIHFLWVPLIIMVGTSHIQAFALENCPFPDLVCEEMVSPK